MKWIPITEELPPLIVDDDEDPPWSPTVLVATKEYVACDTMIGGGDDGCPVWGWSDTKSVTHWMPLPAQPGE